MAKEASEGFLSSKEVLEESNQEGSDVAVLDCERLAGLLRNLLFRGASLKIS